MIGNDIGFIQMLLEALQFSECLTREELLTHIFRRIDGAIAETTAAGLVEIVPDRLGEDHLDLFTRGRNYGQLA